MRVVPLILSILLLGAAPADVPVGQFREWLSFKKQSLDFTSGGVTVHVAPLPCPEKPVGDSACRWDGFNNQGSVTVSAPGIRPVTVTTDRQSECARIAVVRFEPRDPRPGVIIESQSGGSGGELTVRLLLPFGDGYRAVPMVRRGGGILEGQIADFPVDQSGDGRVDLILEDAAFDSTFGCNACTPRPPRIFAVIRSVPTDESDDPALRGVFAADMARLAPGCLSNTSGRNGTCAPMSRMPPGPGSSRRLGRQCCVTTNMAWTSGNSAIRTSRRRMPASPGTRRTIAIFRNRCGRS
jgi:hypothetical protein